MDGCLEIKKPGISAFDQIPDVHGTLLLIKARTLKKLGSYKAAKDICTFVLRRKKGRSQNLINEILYERAGIHGLMGQYFYERIDLECLYATNPLYRDVASRLGMSP
ncbi:hypothetical protein KAU08_03875 [bacterium]|nr:hypothetical protein [bacterium]